MKGEIEALKMNENDNDSDDLRSLDFEGIDDNPFSKKEGKIVKVLKSSHIFVWFYSQSL